MNVFARHRRFKGLSVACLAALALSLGLRCQATTNPVWESMPLTSSAQKNAGIAGGEGFQQVMSIAFSSSDPNIVYFSTDTSGVWRSDDGGRHWVPRAIGYLPNGALSLAVDPNNPDIVLVAAYSAGLNQGRRHRDAARGIYLTEDGGKTWHQVRKTWFSLNPGKGNLVAFVPSVENTERSKLAYAGSDEGLLRSSDGGRSWSVTGLQVGKIRDIKVNPEKSHSLYLTTEQGLFRFDENTCKRIGSGLPSTVVTLAVTAADPNTVYAAVGKSGVYKSTDGGRNFRCSSFGLPSVRFTDVAVSQLDAKIVYVRADRTGAPPFYSHNGGDSWHRPENLDVGDLLDGEGFWFSSPFATHPADAKAALHASNGRSRIIRTEDGGQTWRYSGSGFTGGRMKDIAFLGTGRMVLALTDHGLWYTENGGLTFRELDVLRVLGRKSSNAVDTNGSTLVAAVGGWRDKLIEVSQDTGKTWEVILNTKGEYPFIGFHPQDSKVVYAGRYVSHDAGKSWRRLEHEVVALFPGDGNRIYGLTAKDSGGTLMTCSEDGGRTWRNCYTPLPVGRKQVRDVVIDPEDPNRIYVAYAKGILVHEEGEWINRDDRNGLALDAFGKCFVNCLAVHPKKSNVVYAGRFSPGLGRANGIFCSDDRGMTWKEVNYNLSPGIGIHGVEIDPYSGTVYIGSSLGTFRLSK